MALQEKVTMSRQWGDCLDYMSRRVKEQSFNTWLKPTRGEPTGNGEFKVSVPNQFVADWIDDHFRNLIDEAFGEVLGRKCDIIYVITRPTENSPQTTLNLSGNGSHRPTLPAKVAKIDHNLNHKYTFDSLVVGDFNSFACAASMAIAEGPGMTKYNPLYIYGRTGLGKTHIIQAVGNAVLRIAPGKRVMYATSEKFTSDFIAAISDRAVSDFTKVYRDVDVLIIDDIQFFTGKESTQEQFFHTFNTLYHLGKQIVLSSDRPPKEIRGLEERLLSRFSWGLVTDLQAPDLESRSAILYKKLESDKITIPEAVINFIADRVSTNIRDLEGALNRLLAYVSLRKVPVTLELARKVLSDTFACQKRDITIARIQQKTAEFFRIDPQMMKAKKKTSDVVLARQVSMYLSRSLTECSLKVIGQEHGGRDHSTVIHGCDLISNRLSSDRDFRERLDQLAASIIY